MSVKCLSKIGILQTKEQSDKNAGTIQHKGKLYESLFDFDFKQLAADISRNRDFCLVGLKCDDAEYCTIFRDGTRTPTRSNLESRARILSIVFPEFKSSCAFPCADDEDEEDKVALMNYVTTKLYDLLRAAHLSNGSENTDNEHMIHSRLLPTLRKYQRNTIQWLLRRERESIELQHFYKKFTSTEGCHCYVHLMEFDIMDTLPQNIPIPSGGILADEMGLGKTVEVLALILLNSRTITPSSSSDYPQPPISKKSRTEDKLFCVCRSTKMKKLIQCANCSLSQHKKCVMSYVNSSSSDGEDYICPKCWELQGILVPSAATVIVSPISIKLQWLSEINKHISPPLKVLLYEGASKEERSPKELASYDIILTDYNILRRELNYTASNETNISFRRERQVMRVNSPLLLVEWWRVCLDEAQMESTTSKASQIVKQLPAIHRWAVTGTPIQRSLDDLVALLEFIDLYDISSNGVWQHLTKEFIQGRSDKLVNVLQKIMWRTCKSSVLDDLGIPPQSEVVHYVKLNNAEQLFYSDEHANCTAAFYEKIEGYSDLTEVSPKILKLILQPMLKLRQDCTIPVLCLKSEKNFTKKFLQPQELLDHLRSSNEIECKSQLRTMASSYNGIGAVYFIQAKYDDAIKYYKLVMALANDYTGCISIDSLLQIHALHNMLQAYRIIESKDSSLLEEYETQCNKLEWKYLEPYALNLQSAHKGYTCALNHLNETEEKMPTAASKMWAQLFDAMDELDVSDQLIYKINDEVFTLHSNNLIPRFQSTQAILLVLNLWYEKINKIRKELSDKFNEIDFFVQNVRPRNDVPICRWRMMTAFIRSVYDCHLSEFRNTAALDKQTTKDDNEQKKVCQLCKVEKHLQTYECLVFNKVLDEKSSNTEGTWNPTMQEKILKTIYSIVKGRKELALFVKDCEHQLDAVNLMKTEYKELVKLWIEIEYTVKAYDEMDMCKMRLSTADPDKEKTKYQIYPYEVDSILNELQMNFYQAQKEFDLKYSRLKYLRHLEKDTDPGPCPICGIEEQNKYVVLECGHHMCLMCLKTMSKLQKTNTLNCAICRHEQKYRNVYYVTRKLPTDTDEFEVKGDYSSKIQAIVVQILKLRAADEKVKILIFSQWQPILKIISDALEENSVTFKLKWSPISIQQFKDESLGITCMLMLLHNGSHGLNLVEATHVFLVEPILNPGEELQAIGRVHRIGQTKPTTVHRFIVKYTIEQKIYDVVAKDKTKKWSNLTIDSIKKFFEL